MTREELRLLAARLVAWQCAGHKGCAACPLAPLKAAGGRCAAAVEAQGKSGRAGHRREQDMLQHS